MTQHVPGLRACTVECINCGEENWIVQIDDAGSEPTGGGATDSLGETYRNQSWDYGRPSRNSGLGAPVTGLAALIAVVPSVYLANLGHLHLAITVYVMSVLALVVVAGLVCRGGRR